MMFTKKPVLPALAFVLLTLVAAYAKPVQKPVCPPATSQSLEVPPEVQQLVQQAMTLLDDLLATWQLLVAGPSR